MPREPLRILVIPSSDYLGHPFPQRHNHIFEGLHDGKGFEVHVIRFNIFGKPQLTSKCVIHEIPFEFKTSSTALYYLANVASYTFEIIRIVKRESIDIVFAGNLLPPLTYALVRNLVERKIPVVFDLQDYYPTSAAGYLVDVKSSIGTVIKGLFDAMTRYLIGSANVVTAPGIALAMYAKRVGAKRVYIVPNGVSEHFLVKYNGREIREKLGYSDDDVVVGYIGSIEFWLDMEPLIKAVSITRSKGLPVRLLLVGRQLQTGYPLRVRRWLRVHGVEGITTWLNFVPHSEVPKYIATMDVATIPFDIENPTAYYAAPNKLWEYLSQGALVAATPIPEVLAYRRIDRLFIVRSPGDYVRVFEEASKAERGRDDRHLRQILRQILETRLWSHSVRKLKDLLRSLA